MNELIIQVMLVNFITAALVSVILYFSKEEVRSCNPLIMFCVTSLGTFLGSILYFVLPNFNLGINSQLLKHFVFSIPGLVLSIIFIFVWVKGSKSESFF